MTSFVARRFGHLLATLFGVSLLTFILLDLAPGTYFEQMRMNPQISPDTLSALRIQYGLDQPFAVRYASWLRSVFRGELGFSFAYNSPVWPLLRSRLGNTLILAWTALLLSWLIAIPAGVWAGARRRRWEDRLIGVGTTFLTITPDVLVGLALLAFALRTRWLPPGGIATLTQSQMGPLARFQDSMVHMILPVAALTAISLPMLLRHVRSSVGTVLSSSYIMAARSHGISRARLLWRHAFPAAANPLISLFGVSVGMLLGGSLLIEVIMGWPGMGSLLLQAIFEHDVYIVVAAVMASTLLLMTGNFMADILLYFADPRIRKD